MQTARTVRITWRLLPVRRIATRAVIVQISAQSMQVRMHWLMSIGSATQASAQLLQIAAQSITLLTARPSVSL